MVCDSIGERGEERRKLFCHQRLSSWGGKGLRGVAVVGGNQKAMILQERCGKEYDIYERHYDINHHGIFDIRKSAIELRACR